MSLEIKMLSLEVHPSSALELKLKMVSPIDLTEYRKSFWKPLLGLKINRCY